MGSIVNEFFCTGLFKGVLNGAILLSIHLDYAEHTFKVILATVWLLVVFLAFPTGTHLNCTITAAAVTTGDLGFVRGLGNIAAQLAGVAVAMTAVRALAPDHLHRHLEPPSPAGGDVAWGFALEVLFTFTNVIAAFGCEDIWGPTFKAVGTASIVVLEITLSGASMDPSGAFAGAFFTGELLHFWEIYYGAAMLGGVLAGLTWRAIRPAAADKAKAE